MAMRRSSALRSIAVTVVGWLLVVIGIAALVLPGPGLLALFAGLAVLSQQYEWAERRVKPVKQQAFKTAWQSVQSWPRIVGSTLGSLALMAVGVVWGIRPDTPSWWPLRESWWLLGGWGTGATLIFSGLVALGMVVYSFVTFRDQPAPVT